MSTIKKIKPHDIAVKNERRKIDRKRTIEVKQNRQLKSRQFTL